MTAEPFSFEKKDFVIKAEKENAEARQVIMKKLRSALESNLSDNFKEARIYVSGIGYQYGHEGEFRDHTWIGVHFKNIFPHQKKKDKKGQRNWQRDIPQFQVSLDSKGLRLLLNLDHSSDNMRKVVHELLENQKNKCFDILKKLDPDVTVFVKTKNRGKKFTASLPTDKKMEWSISKLQLQDMDEIIKFLSKPEGQLRVGIQFSESEAMKTSIVDELSNGFEKLYPLYTFLTEQNSPKSESCNYWAIKAGKQTPLWSTMLSSKTISFVGHDIDFSKFYDEVGNYKHKIPMKSKVPDELRDEIDKKLLNFDDFPKDTKSRETKISWDEIMIHPFMRIKKNDIVVVWSENKIHGYGKVVGGYEYKLVNEKVIQVDADGMQMHHQKRVEWLDTSERNIPQEYGISWAAQPIQELPDKLKELLFGKKQQKYFIITQYEDSDYDDVEGEQYQYDSNKQNSKRFVEGSNFIVQSKINGVNHFVAYGKVGTIVQSKDTTKKGKSITKFVAKYSDYTPFEETKIRTDEIHQKMKDQKSWNDRASILPIDQSLYAEIIGEDLIDNDQLTGTLDSTNLDECKEFESKGYLEILKRKRNLIFYGPPGTGKTFTAEGLARCLDKQNYDEQDNRRHTWKTVSALVLLENEGKALNYHEIAKRAIVKDLVSTIGKTKHETIAKEIRNDIETNGEDSIFTHPSQGMYGLNVPTTFAKAAEMILLAENEPLHSDKITEIALHNKIIKQNEEPGITPTRSMNQILSQDVTNNDKNSTFISTGPATYTLRKKNPVSRQPNEKYYELVTFHPSYSYEDFVEGFRPTGGNIAALLANQMYDEIKLPEELTEDQKNEIQKLINIYKREWRKQASRGQPQFNNLSHYVLEPGIFKIMCSNAKNHGDKKYILIIDEINRGNISKILGELITLIESSYRGPKFTLKLAYSKEDFYIPDNIYIIGTMNTADTSLIQVDAALRRRFAWKELMPDEEIEFVDEKFKIVMKKINEKIKIKKLRDKQIGHTYFMHLKDDNDFKFTFLTEIIPLLQDYFFHDYAELEEVLGKGVIDVEKLDVKKELLDLEGEEFFEKVKTSLETSS